MRSRRVSVPSRWTSVLVCEQKKSHSCTAILPTISFQCQEDEALKVLMKQPHLQWQQRRCPCFPSTAAFKTRGSYQIPHLPVTAWHPTASTGCSPLSVPVTHSQRSIHPLNQHLIRDRCTDIRPMQGRTGLLYSLGLPLLRI